jgi:hypothetical protein
MKYTAVFEFDDIDKNLGMDLASNRTGLVAWHLQEKNIVFTENELVGVYPSEDFYIGGHDGRS